MGENGTRMRVRCQDCTFERVTCVEDGRKPADVLIDHGQRTGHTLAVERVEE
ncbi:MULTISPECIES: hypothetical protein [Halorussus]|uniref:hypothetical protein n=1 Tax=Halorussus TaxID=1070314 RepID=UPI0013B41335|nr:MULTISPECIES: hypothetical protein [Halorussus]NHN59259.1 hypothetical protein [Halorussus sp. JP-T4]